MLFLDLIDKQIAAQERALEAHPAFIELRALRAARAAYVAAENSPRISAPPVNSDVERSAAPSRRRNAPAMGGKSLDAVTAVVEILAAHGKPLRTAELLPHVTARGIIFKGNAPQNILSSLLSRSDDVVSKGGHVGWALASWDSTEGVTPSPGVPSVDVQPHSGPVEPGQEVAHDNIG